MKTIVKLEWDGWNNELEIMESIGLLDKREHYEAKFRYPNGYVTTAYFIKKSSIGTVINNIWTSHIDTLYVNGTKYHKDPEYYKILVKSK